MSYKTSFKLEVIGDSDIDHEEEINQEYNGGYNLFEDSQSWYTWDEDMKEYSLRYPELLFKLEGIGDMYDDVWKCYFKNGKMQECPAIITFDDYDESKLI